MLKLRFTLLALLLLSGCTSPNITPIDSDEAHVSTDTTDTTGPMAHHSVTQALPMSPLDPALQHNELEALPDLWLRIRQQMQIEVPDRADIRREIAFYAGKQKFFNEVASRAEPYLYLIVNELEKRNMPIELALLPIVESAFNPAAQGNGPAGLWQMVPGTARNFGLKVQSGYDGRKDPLSSTYAVLDYLQHLHDSLGNDWLNAVAAYNTGEGRIMAAVARNTARGKPTDYWSLHIPARFVQTMPKWLAMIELIRSPQDHRLQLPVIANKPVVGLTRIAGAVHLQNAADIAGISVNELKRLNPAFRLAMTPKGKDFPLVLPLTAVEAFEQQRHLLKTVAVTTPTETTKRSYKVKSGDSLGSIAARNKTTIKKLRQLNRLSSDSLKVGQTLQLPGSSTTSMVATNNQTKNQSYQVKSGENLWTIAKKLRIDAEELRVYNKLRSDVHLQPGQTLKVPKPSSVKSARNNSVNKTAMHTVKKGDSLDRIARKYKIKLSDLLLWNQLKTNSTLTPGQQLLLAPRRQQS